MRTVIASDSGTSREIRPLLHETSGQGEPLVLMPGGLTGWASWAPLAVRLANRHTVIRMQLRSVERAEAGETHPADYGTLTEREGLRGAVAALGLERFDLSGWSYGAHVSLAYALEYPERIRTLTLIEPPATWILRETGWNSPQVDTIEAYDREMTGRAITIDELKAFLIRAGLGTPDTDFETLPGWSSWLAHRQALAVNGTIWDYTDSLDRLRALDVPILLVRGIGTAPWLSRIIDVIAATAPCATLLELPGGHACHLQNPERFLSALEAHIASSRKA